MSKLWNDFELLMIDKNRYIKNPALVKYCFMVYFSIILLLFLLFIVIYATEVIKYFGRWLTILLICI
jgi:uncharacterized integral membrane protein